MTTQSHSIAARSPFPGMTGRPLPVLRGRRALAALGLAVVAAGLAWQWTWLTAIGVAPVLVSLAPCAAMCALGLCMNRTAQRSCATDPDTHSKRAAGSPPSDNRGAGPSGHPCPQRRELE